MDRASRRGVASVVLVVVLIGAFLWFGRQAFPGVDLAFAAALLAVLAYSHWQADEGWRELGFRWDTFGSTSRLLLPFVLIACVLIWSAAVVLPEIGFARPEKEGTGKIALFVVFGIAQQYVMLGFIFKRVERAAGERFAPALTALLFALLHLPNAFLTLATFVWGIVACHVYRRSPNLWANGLAHGLLSALLYYTLPRSVTGGLRVGMEYLAALSS
jgi:membrane protease YdiL (CAAX protease family)